MTTFSKMIALGLGGVILLLLGFLVFVERPSGENPRPETESVQLSGTYECLPHLNPGEMQTQECAFGFKTDAGQHYAVNFGASANAMEQFRSGAHVTAQGFVVPKAALSDNQWMRYDMVGMFTVTKVQAQPAVQGKINIDAVCTGALAYMSFPDGASADAFVAECVAGKHPEVIERYKDELNVGDGAQI